MKKIFTLIAAAMVAVCVNAQKWNATSVDNLPEGTVLVNNTLAEIKTALQDATTVVIKNESGEDDPKTFGGYTFKKYVGLRSTDAPSASNPAGTVHESNITVVVTAKENVDVVAYYRRGAAKAISCYDQTDGSSVSVSEKSGIDDPDYPYMIGTFVLQKGHVYTIYARGGTVQLNGLDTKEGTYVAPEPSKTTFYANAAAATVDGFSTMTYTDGAKVALIGNNTKAYSNGSGITINGQKHTTTKVSNGAQNMFFAPEGKFITKATIWSYVNKDAATERDCYWKEVNGQAYSLDGAEGTIATTIMNSYKNLDTPDSYTYELGGISGFTFTNTGEQACFVIEIEYGAEGPTNGINEAVAAPAVKVVKAVENGQLVIKSAKGSFNVAGARIK